MPKIDVTHEFFETIRDAAEEIASLAGPDNDVCRRLRGLLTQITPHSVTVGQLAKRIDVAPYDILDAAIDVGVKPFWHEGQQFREAAYLRTYLRLESPCDPVREVEFELTPETARQLAEKLGVTPEELLQDADSAAASGSPPRKFVASDSRWPWKSEESRRQHSG